jgi:hypothetical protein
MFAYHGAAETIAELNERNVIECAHIVDLFDLCVNGCSYSNQDFDVISAARAELREQTTKIPDYKKPWVESRASQKAKITAAKKWAFEVLREKSS